MGVSVYRLMSLARRVPIRWLGPLFCQVGLVWLLVLGMGLPASISSAVEPAGVSLVSSSPQAVRFSVSGLEPVWVPQTVGDPAVTMFEVGLGGFVSSGEPGHPRLPRAGGWVVVPPGTRPELKIISEEWQPAGDRLLMVESVPVIIQGAESWENSASEILVLPNQDPPADALIPPAAQEALARRGRTSGSAAVTLGKESWWRGRRIVSYQVLPVRHDAAGRSGQVLASGTWEIRFVPDDKAGLSINANHAKKSSSRGDDRFSHSFLNGEFLAQFPTEAAWRGLDFSAPDGAEKSGLNKLRGDKSGTLLGHESRLAVWKTGLARVTYATLRDNGLLPSGAIAENQIRLYQRRYLSSLDDGSGQAPYIEVEVPIHMIGEGDNFDGDDFFVFYGLRLRDDGSYEADLGDGPVTIPGCGDPTEINNATNFYWLAASEPDAGQSWARMESTTLPAATGTPLAGYRRTDHIEEQVAFRENLPTEEVDRLYYNTYRSRGVSAGINPLWAPDPAGTDVDLKIGVVGKNQISRPLRFELITDSSLTTLLGDIDLASIMEITLEYTVPASAIDGDFAEITMNNSQGSNSWVFSYLNWVEISYDALYQAIRDRLTFPGGPGSGPQPLVVSGYSSADIGLFEVTDPRNPVVVQLDATNITTTDNLAWSLSVMPDQAGGQTRTFESMADFSTDGVDPFPHHLSSPSLDPVNPTQLAGADPDMIVITHPDFRPALQRWIDHRMTRADGNLTIHVVDVNDLFDWYSGGLKDAWALKRFTNHAITSWNSWALTVVGDANENVLGKGVLPEARSWSKDWVPTHYHVQRALLFDPELMASDKWYVAMDSGNNYPEDNFPSDVQAPWAMYTGRFPCNSIAELDIMIDKIMVVENVAAGQDWRRKGIFFADDQWSNGYGADAQSLLSYKFNETVFATSERDSLSRLWSSGSPVALDSVLVLLADTMDEVYPYDPPPPTPPDRDLYDLQRDTGAIATPILIGKLSEGGLVAHYQGHANQYVLSSEYWMQDKDDGVARRDVAQLGNTDRPWFYMGLGCHIADWAQNTVLTSTTPHERSITEKFIMKSRSGASAGYASSGYEYISENRVFGEYIFRRWMVNPPSQRTIGGGAAMRSRWVLGELMWAAEADIYAVNPRTFIQEMISQFVLLGDPLMGLDAGEPVVTATLVGNPDMEISGEVEIEGIDGTNLRTINIIARDEAGIDRLTVVDETGMDVTAGIVTETLPPGATNHQLVNYTLQVPVQPYDHDLRVQIWDTGGSLATDRHYELLLQMPQTAEFTAGGNPIDPATFIFPADSLMTLSAAVSSAAWLLDYSPDSDFSLTSKDATLTLSNVQYLLNKNEHLTVQFDATSATQNADDQHILVLAIDGYETELVLQEGTAAEHSETIGKVYNYPNPMIESTRFIFESGLARGDGTIRVFSVAGRPVAHIQFRFPGGGAGIVDWDGRDDSGDQMANGTYLYRVEIDSGNGVIVSDMQRLVMMR